MDTPPDAPQQPAWLGPFALERRIGRGGSAEVWAARHADGTPVAVKVLLQLRARDPRFARALREEVRAVAALSHPGIVAVLDEGEIDTDAERASVGALAAGSPYLAMELASGGALDRHDPPMSFAALRDVLLALLDALAHAHARGVVHRDLKPGNVLVSTEDDLRPGLKLSDFGLAVALGRTPELAATAGTPAFMAPEQFRGEWRAIGPWTDLYALGCMAWYWATHRPLFQGDQKQLARAHQAQALPSFHPRFAVPDGFGGWLEALLEKDPRARCPRAADAAHALLQLGLPETFGPPLAGLGRMVTPPTRTEVPDSEFEVVESTFTGAAAAPRPALAAPPVPESWDGGVPPAMPTPLADAGLALFGSRAVPLVGRTEERDALWQALREVARTGLARALVLRGPAGSGKTRLAEWLCQRAEEVGAALALRAVHAPRGGPADGLGGMLARHLRTAGLSGPELRAWLAERLPEDVSAEAAAGLVGDAASTVRWSRAEDRFTLVRRILHAEAGPRPLVLWVDDAQWGADAVRFVRWLLAAEPLPVLAVLTHRDEGGSELLPGVVTIDVPPLAGTECAALLRKLLALDPPLAARVAERADGNPLFAVQLVGDWVARGALRPGPHGFVLAEDARTSIPDDLHALWARRVDLAVGREDAAQALEIAAVLGTEVDDAEWRDVARRLGAPVRVALGEDLLVAGLAVGRTERWRFAHGLLRESLERRAADGLRLARIHAAAAGMLATLPGGPARARRARHLVEAGRLEDALPELVGAAAEVSAAGDAALAAALLDDHALALERLALPDDDLRRGEGLALLVENLVRQEDLAEALAAGERATALARRHGWRRALAATLRATATAGYLTGRLDEAERAFVESQALAAAEDDAEAEMAALCGRGHVARMRGALADAALRYEEALALRTTGAERWARDALMGLGITRHRLGQRELALEVLTVAKALVERTGTPTAQVGVHTILGEIARDEGDLPGALEHYRQAAEIDRGVGRDALVPRLNLALVLVLSERWTEARRTIEPVLARARARRSLSETYGRCALLVCDAAEGRWEAFDLGVEAVARVVEETGLVEADVAGLMQLAGRHAARAGHEDRAGAAFAVALRQYRALGQEDRVAEVRGDMLGKGDG